MEDLKKQFELLNKTGNVPLGGFKKEDFQSNPKVKAIISIMRSAIDNIKKSAEDIFEEFNVKFNISASDGVSEPYVNAVNFDFQNDSEKQTLLMSLNFNFSKLATLPGPEIYTFVYYTLRSSLLQKRKSMPNSNEYKFGKEVDLEEKSAENDQNFDREGKYKKPKNIFVEYIKAFLRKLFGLDAKAELDNFSEAYLQNAENNFEQTAQEVAKTFAAKGIVANEMFDNPPTLSGESKNLSENENKLSDSEQTKTETELEGESQTESTSTKKAESEELDISLINEIVASRKDDFESKTSSKVSSKKNGIDIGLIDEILASRYSSVVKQGNHQQATYLMGVFLNDDFNVNSLVGANEAQLKDFCEKFARRFLQNSGLDASSYKITYDKFDRYGNERAAGTYIDYGSSQTININISQVKAINNPAEVVMILAHELTHAVDSSVNKQKGKVTEEGYGLLNNTIGVTGGLEQIKTYERVNSNDSKDVERVNAIYRYAVKLTEACYRLNPNERSAREGELIALEFMKGLTPNKTMQRCIDSSIVSYNNYQNAVISDYRNLEEIISEAKTIRGMCRSSETKEIIDSRINYLKQLKENNLLNISGVKESIEAAKKINEGEMIAEGPSNG